MKIEKITALYVYSNLGIGILLAVFLFDNPDKFVFWLRTLFVVSTILFVLAARKLTMKTVNSARSFGNRFLQDRLLDSVGTEGFSANGIERLISNPTFSDLDCLLVVNLFVKTSQLTPRGLEWLILTGRLDSAGFAAVVDQIEKLNSKEMESLDWQAIKESYTATRYQQEVISRPHMPKQFMEACCLFEYDQVVVKSGVRTPKLPFFAINNLGIGLRRLRIFVDKSASDPITVNFVGFGSGTTDEFIRYINDNYFAKAPDAVLIKKKLSEVRTLVEEKRSSLFPDKED